MIVTNILSAAFGLTLCRLVAAATSADWRSRTIYQVMTDRFALTNGSTTAPCNTGPGLYCGGTWQGLRSKLDYIQNMGFDAVWISPVTKQLEGNTGDGSAYHGYWQQDIYSVNSHFGTPQDLVNLAADLHNRGMYLMVDIVTNHFASNGLPTAAMYATFNPFNSSSYYHPKCKIDYEDYSNTTNIEQCWEGDDTVPLPDLRTEDADVYTPFNNWITGLVTNYSIDGLRIDSLMEVNTGFWSKFQTAAGVYSVGEVDEASVNFVCSFQKYVPGVLNYGMYYPLINAFESTSGSISALANAIDNVKSACSDTSLIGTFSENHDVPRFAGLNGDFSLAKNVITFTMLTDGIPIIYEGQEQHYASQGGTGNPYNREAVWLSGYNTTAELYEYITTLNKIRRNARYNDAGYLTYRNYHIYNSTSAIAMRKGQMVTVLTNAGSSGPAASTLTFASGYAAGTKLTELVTCATLTADSKGNLAVPMSQGLPRIYYPSVNITQSGLCGTTAS